jgi:hypothetical protein
MQIDRRCHRSRKNWNASEVRAGRAASAKICGVGVKYYSAVTIHARTLRVYLAAA